MKRAIFLIAAIIFAIALTLQSAGNAPIYIDDSQPIINGENGGGQAALEDEGGLPAEPDDEYAKGASNEEIFTDTGIKVQALVASLNVRTAPTTSSNVLGSLSAGAKVDYIEAQENWYKIRYDGQTAYVSANASYTRLIDSNAGKVAALIDAVIDEGIKVLGTPYEYGSQRLLNWNGTLNNNFTGKTFDCSAFVQYAFYKGAGIKLNGDSRSQSTQGIPVSLDRLEKGDILIMTSSSRLNNTGIERIGHVAIYMGNNKILHTFGTGGVRIQDYSEFWKGRTLFVRRAIY